MSRRREISGAPECWNGRRLGWAGKGQGLRLPPREDEALGVQGKLWFCASDRLCKVMGIFQVGRGKTHLYAGMGEPWAGQTIARDAPELLVSLRPSFSMENFGFAPPIGSV